MNAVLLQGLPSFARGYLLAAAWRGAGSTDADGEAAQLKAAASHEGGSAIEAGWAELLALSSDDQAALRREWLLSEPEQKLESALDLHWSWLPHALEDEPPALLVLLLHSMPPDSAKETLRAMWPRLRNVSSKELDGASPNEGWLASLRASFFTRFTLLSPAGARAFAPLLFLGRRELHLFLQETGLEEIALAGGDLSPELEQRLESFEGVDATRVRRLMKRGGVADATRSALARAHLEAGLHAAGTKGDLVGLVALDHVGFILSESPSGEIRYLAQRLGREQGEQLLAACQAWSEGGRGEIEPSLRASLGEELTHRIAAVVSRTAMPTVANRVWA